MDDTGDLDAADPGDALPAGTPPPATNERNWVPVAVVDPATTPSQPLTTVPSHSVTNDSGKYLGWILALLLLTALNVAIVLATQLDTDASPPTCSDRYAECCDGDERAGMCVERCDLRFGYYNGCDNPCAGWDDNWGPCEPPCGAASRNGLFDPCDEPCLDRDGPDGDGLFDSETEFARSSPPDC